MIRRLEHLRESISMTLNSTYVLDLPANGMLSSLMLRVSGTEVSGLGQSGGSWRIQDYISKIEVIANGSTVIKSLTAREAKAMAFYDQGITSPDSLRNYAANTQYSFFLINFGTKMGDQNLGLDLSKFQNVELRITNSATSSQFADLTATTVGVFLHDLQTGSFRGYLRSEIWKEYTTVADETKYNELPVENIIRRILLTAIPAVDSSYIAKDNLYNLMDDIDLSLDTGAVRLFKGGWDDMMRLNYFDYGHEVIVNGSNYNSADKGFDGGVGYVPSAVFGTSSKSGAVATTFVTRANDENGPMQHAESYGADNPIDFIIRGQSYQDTAVLRFDYDQDSGLWLDPNQRKTVKLNLHTKNDSNDAGGTNRITLDRLVRY